MTIITEFAIILSLGLFALCQGQDVHPCQEPPGSGCYYYRPHEDCNRVWNCRENPPYLDRCNPDRYWDQERCICNHQGNVTECVGGTRPPPTTTTTTTTTTTPPTPETEGTITTTLPTPSTTTLAPGQCPENGTIKIPHEERCGSYYICEDGVREERDCPPGLWFDPNYQECNIPNDFCTPVTTTLPPQPQCPPNGTHQVPNPNGDCSTYVLCMEGEPVMIVNCPEGMLFDVIDNICKPESIAVCLVWKYFGV